MSDSDFLKSLSEKLGAIKRRQLATQKEIATATGVAQEDISKVMHGRRQRRTASLDRLDAYADMLLGAKAMPPTVSDAVREFLAFGTEAELVASIRLCTRLVARRPASGTEAKA